MKQIYAICIDVMQNIEFYSPHMAECISAERLTRWKAFCLLLLLHILQLKGL